MTLQFKKPDPAKVKEQERIAIKAKEAADAAIVHAQNCLRDPEFIKYKEQYIQMGDVLMDELIMIDAGDVDPVEYGFRCKDVVSKYRHIGALLRAVEAEAGR